MNKFFLITWYLFIIQDFIAQQRYPAIILYDKGNAAIARKDYIAADSLFTLSLNLSPHPDSYYNRAVSRRKLNDFKGYCVDLRSASELGDTESKSLFWKQCAKADTIYKNHEGDVSTKDNYDFVEHIASYKYNTDFEYEKLDTADAPLLAKIRRNNEVIYKYCKDVNGAKYRGGADSLVKFIKTHTDFSNQVMQKRLVGGVFILVDIDEKGKVKELQNRYGDNDEAVIELLKGLRESPNWIPASYNNRDVKFQATLAVSYYDNELLVFSGSFLDKDSSVVEVMPEFAGGVTAMLRYIQKNIQYPQRGKEAGLQGKCVLRFVVLPNGKISNMRILRGVPGCIECDREAARVIYTMPPWKPGTQNRKAVPVYFTMPINFQLK